MDLRELNEAIDRKFADLPKQLRVAARFVRENPEQIALNPLRTTAEQAKIHPSNLMRLIKELGFERYNEFREPFRVWLKGRGTSMSDRVQGLRSRGRQGRSAEIVGDVFQRELANLQSTFEAIKIRDLEKATRIIASAERVFIIGLRSLYSAAFFLDYSCKLFTPKTILVEGRGGTLSDELRTITPRDAAVALTHRRYSRDAFRAVEFAARAGASVVAIVDSPLAPTAPLAAVSLVVGAASPSLLPSPVPTIAVLQALIALLVGELGEKSASALKQSEIQLKEFAAFLDD